MPGILTAPKLAQRAFRTEVLWPESGCTHD